MNKILADFMEGGIRPEDVPLHVEPILQELAIKYAQQEEARTIVNEIERTIYRESEPARTQSLVRSLKQAIVFVGWR